MYCINMRIVKKIVDKGKLGGDMAVRVQELAIFDYLQAGGSLTALDALERFGCFRLAARIYSLRQAIKIDSERVKVGGKYIVRYRLAA